MSVNNIIQYTCDRCNKVFITSRGLCIHKRVHKKSSDIPKCASPAVPLAAQIQPLAAQIQPLAAQIQPLAAQIQPLAAQIQPLAAQIQPLAAQIQPLAAQIQCIVDVYIVESAKKIIDEKDKIIDECIRQRDVVIADCDVKLLRATAVIDALTEQDRTNQSTINALNNQIRNIQDQHETEIANRDRTIEMQARAIRQHKAIKTESTILARAKSSLSLIYNDIADALSIDDRIDPTFNNVHKMVRMLIESNNNSKCVVCYTSVAVIALIPCGHRILCAECESAKIKHCPQCRCVIKNMLRVY